MKLSDYFARGRVDRRKGADWDGRRSHEGDSIRNQGKEFNTEFAEGVPWWEDPLGRTETIGFFELDGDHAETLRRNGGAGFGAVFEFVEAVNIFRLQLAATDVKKRAYHLTDHIAEKRAAAHGEDEFFVVGGAVQFGGIDFALGGTLFVVFFRAGGSGKRRKIVVADKPGSRVAHGVFIKRKRIVQDITPEHRRNDFPAIEAVAVDFPARGPARVEVGAHFLGRYDANGGREKRVERALKFSRG